MATKKIPATPKPKAVVCDDDPMSRSLLRAVLERCGYDVIAGVGTAMEAMQVVLTYNPDVLLLDLVLPSVSGETIIPALRASAPDCTIIVCSSFDPSVAVRNGATFVIPKGSVTQLEATLTALASRPKRIAV